MKHDNSISIKEFKEYFLDKTYNENMFNTDGSINTNYNSFKKTGTIAKILEDHWDKVYEKYKINIDKKDLTHLKKLKRLLIVIIKI